MKIDELKKSYKQLSTNKAFDEKVRKHVLENTKPNIFYRTKGLAIAIVLVIVLLTNVTVYAFSAKYRVLLADILHINSDETHYIEGWDSNNGVVMTVVSSHVVNKTATILITFEKKNGEKFRNGMNPRIDTLKLNGKKIATYGGVNTELSEDSKILLCYYTWNFSKNVTGENVELSVKDLICNESQIAGKTWIDELIKGKWTVPFKFMEDTDNTLTVLNNEDSHTVSMCGKELRIDSIVLSDMLLIVNTKTLSDKSMPEDAFSSISKESGSYYDVYIQLKYNDGTMSEKLECSLDDDNNIISWVPETIKKEEVKEVYVGNVVIEISE